MSTENQHNNWSDALPALVLLLLHAVCCIGVALFVLLGGVGLSALLASWAIAIGVLGVSAGGYWYFRHRKGSSCQPLNSDEKSRSTRVLYN